MPIEGQDTFGTLSQRLQAVSAELLIDVLDAGPGGAVFHEQSEEGVTYADKISAEDRLLDPAQPAAELERRVRALTPHIGAAITLPGGEQRLGVWRAQARPAADGDPSQGELDLGGERPVLGCGQGTALVLDEVQPAGGRAMDAAAWLRGRR
jgi:methionyl-tRNA formyltransferase